MLNVTGSYHIHLSDTDPVRDQGEVGDIFIFCHPKFEPAMYIRGYNSKRKVAWISIDLSSPCWNIFHPNASLALRLAAGKYPVWWRLTEIKKMDEQDQRHLGGTLEKSMLRFIRDFYPGYSAAHPITVSQLGDKPENPIVIS